MIPLLWYLNVMIDTAHTSRKKGVTSVIIWQVRPKIDRYYALHGRPPRSAVVLHTDPPSQPSPADPHSFVSATDKFAFFNEFLKWSEDRKLSSSTAYVAHTGTSFVSLTQSSSVGPWMFDSGVTSHYW